MCMKCSEVSKVSKVPNMKRPTFLLNAQCVFDEGEAL
jgi:hypothetical protein